MKNKQPLHIRSITEFHRIRKLPPPEHPLISVVTVENLSAINNNPSLIMDFYSVSLKKGLVGKIRYGQQSYDFDEGVMFFISPGQLFVVEHHAESDLRGQILLIHPDFLWNTPLSVHIRKYEYFSYAVNEALFLSAKEEKQVQYIFSIIEEEYKNRADRFSQSVIIAQLELLFTYSQRYYDRQFLVRKPTNHQVLEQLERLLNTLFNEKALIDTGIPTVQQVADRLNISTGYLSSLLKSLTGMSTQQIIHDKVIERAKQMLSTTDLTVSEVAYTLGFGQPQSFSRLFKTKTGESPLKFRTKFS